jgi:hypothetical protein
MGCPLVLAARLHRRRRTTGPQRRHRRYRRGGACLAVCAPQATQAMSCFVSTGKLCFCWADVAALWRTGGRRDPACQPPRLCNVHVHRQTQSCSAHAARCPPPAERAEGRAHECSHRIQQAAAAASGKARTVPVIAHRCQRFRPAACLDGCTAALAQGCAPSPPRATERRLS